MYIFNNNRKRVSVSKHLQVTQIGCGIYSLSSHNNTVLMHYCGYFSRPVLIESFLLYLHFKDELWESHLYHYITLHRTQVWLVIKDSNKRGIVTYEEGVYKIKIDKTQYGCWGRMVNVVLSDTSSKDPNVIVRVIREVWRGA